MILARNGIQRLAATSLHRRDRRRSGHCVRARDHRLCAEGSVDRSVFTNSLWFLADRLALQGLASECGEAKNGAVRTSVETEATISHFIPSVELTGSRIEKLRKLDHPDSLPRETPRQACARSRKGGPSVARNWASGMALVRGGRGGGSGLRFAVLCCRPLGLMTSLRSLDRLLTTRRHTLQFVGGGMDSCVALRDFGRGWLWRRSRRLSGWRSRRPLKHHPRNQLPHHRPIRIPAT